MHLYMCVEMSYVVVVCLTFSRLIAFFNVYFPDASVVLFFAFASSVT